ncbi:tetratricopeptide repeat protein [Streptomyces sp. NPDC048332]|uniref:tetratricopeptide repeat protein n=1 Tax=Streptomyces sp. NPDC048332 TaxID=3154619 RepID=UPI003441D6DA
MRSRKRRSPPASGQAAPHAGNGLPAQPVAAAGADGTHDAGTAATGYRGPVPGPAAPSGGGLVQVSRTGDATASWGATAISGYVRALTVVNEAAPRTPAAWPHQVGVLPARALSFQHRAERDQLRATMGGGGTAVLSQVLTGTGGVGKTQLAADYARSAWESGEVDVLVWISASSRSAITAGYAQAGVEILAADPGDPEQAARAFLAWLEPKAERNQCRWLVVLDDIADPADIRGLWPPAGRHGRVLVTTRRREAALTGAGRRLVTVGLFTPREAAAYVTAVLAAHDRHEPADRIDGLAADLGHLPLALAQAAAYIVDAGLTCGSYRELLADRMAKLSGLLPEPGALPDDQTVTVAATWSLSVERANRIRPAGLAGPMLQLAAMLDPNGVPAAVLAGEPALAHLAEHRVLTGEDFTEEPEPVLPGDALSALRALHRLSLIDHSPDSPHQAVRVHQLIQRATRDSLTPGSHHRIARAAADALLLAWPSIERDTALAQSLRGNTQALTRHAEGALYGPAGLHTVLFRAGVSLADAGQVAAAVDYFQHLASTADERLGPEHVATLGARHNLAHCRGEAGDPAAALRAFAELLAQTSALLGADHPYTLATRSSLAQFRGEAGDAAGAATAFAELVADQARILGADHPGTLVTREKLAGWRGQAGDASGAATAFAELLPHRLRVLGPDHPHTLSTRSGLAHYRGEAGDAAGAVTTCAELLADLLRVLGPDHPETLGARHSLAGWRGEAGDAAGAADALTELLADRLRILGPDHPETLTTRQNIAHYREVAGDLAGATTACAELLTDQRRILGPDHPATLATRQNIAHYRGEAGDAAGAAGAQAELLSDLLRVHGPDHPFTLATRSTLAKWRGVAGDVTGAVNAFRELVTDTLRVLGPDHTYTLIHRHNLAKWLVEAGDSDEGIAACEQLLHDMLRVLGPDHPHTLTARHHLAEWRGNAGDAAWAAHAFAELLPHRLRVLGPDHPETLTTRQRLAWWRGQTGDPAGAAAAYADLVADRLRVLGPDHPLTLIARHGLARCRGEAGETAGAAAELGRLLPDLLRVLSPDHPLTLSARSRLAQWSGGSDGGVAPDGGSGEADPDGGSDAAAVPEVGSAETVPDAGSDGGAIPGTGSGEPVPDGES